MLHLHSHRPMIIHRDFKSPNLLVDKHWRVKGERKCFSCYSRVFYWYLTSNELAASRKHGVQLELAANPHSGCTSHLGVNVHPLGWLLSPPPAVCDFDMLRVMDNAA